MKQIRLILLAVFSVVAIGGCAHGWNKVGCTLVGTAAGGGIGAAVSNDGSHDGENALYGAAAGAALGFLLCPEAQAAPAPADSDGDGVPDASDQCPGTPAGAAVDANGCELDSDGDGVKDSMDQCPGTEAGASVDEKGCKVLGAVTALEGVNFDTNSANLKSESYDVLAGVAETLNAHSAIHVEVAGHTDSAGDAGYNQGLSQRRAETVMNYLATKGVSADRMRAKGYGETQPVADNGTAAGRAANRRVELRVLN